MEAPDRRFQFQGIAIGRILTIVESGFTCAVTAAR